jgi:hypothetical protein
MKDKKIDIAQVIGTQNAILQKFGLQVAEFVLAEKSNTDTITLDFSNLNNATSGFFHASIGNLKKELNGTFSSTIKTIGLEKNPTWLDKYQDAIDVVTKPYMSTEIDKAIAELFD